VTAPHPYPIRSPGHVDNAAQNWTRAAPPAVNSIPPTTSPRVLVTVLVWSPTDPDRECLTFRKDFSSVDTQLDACTICRTVILRD
jgi:hypothetical protein